MVDLDKIAYLADEIASIAHDIVYETERDRKIDLGLGDLVELERLIDDTKAEFMKMRDREPTSTELVDVIWQWLQWWQ